MTLFAFDSTSSPCLLREFEGPVKYGAILAIKSPASKERLLGLRDGNKLGFWRHVIGQGEKWQILKANTGLASSSGPSHYLGSEDMSARGKYVRVGDSLLIQTFKSDHFLSLNEGSTLEPKLIYKERTGLGSELWQIEVFGAVPLPSWYQNRPYLSGKYLVMPPALRTPAPEVEARVFPKSVNNNASFLQHTAQNSLNPLNEFHVSEQHYVLMRELLLLLSGIEGNYIRVAAAATSAGLNVSAKASQASRTYTVPEISHLPKVMDVKLIIDIDSADRSSATQVTQLLSICESVIKTRDFIKQHSRYEYGFVSHAMCSAIKAVMRDFDILVCQLEHLLNTNRLTLQKMVFLLQPSKVTMQVLEKLTTAVRELTGGHLLNVLYLGLLDQGDTKAKELYEHLLLKASEPFLKMLSLWIFRGELHDPYKEFMIAEDSSVSKDSLQEDFNAQYWDNRYTLNIKHIPKILSNHAQKALTAGKYLNVVRDCVGDYVVAASVASSAGPAAANASKGVLVSYNKSLKGSNKEEKFADLVLPKEQELILELERNDSTLTRAIEEAYQFSSQALLKLLESGYGLHSHFQSLGRFFLLEHGDFFIQFMDTAEEDLRREVKEIAISRVQNLLQLAVQTSTLATDAHREDLSCTLASHNLIQHLHLIQMAGESGSADIYTSLASQGLKGIEAFTLDYKVGWPLSIVLSRRAITKYQLLSRLLYFSKHVERRLLYSWSSHQTSKEFNVRGALGSSFCLRHRMLHFIQNFVYYITLEVINPRSHELEEEIVQATDMDQVLELHEKFLDACLKECLLASQDLLKILTKIMTTCLLFADHITRFMEDCEQQEVSSTPTRKTKSEPSPLGGADKKLSSTSSFRGNASTVADPQTIKEAAKLKVQQEKRRNRISDSTEVIQSETSHESFQRILAKFSTTFDEQVSIQY